MELRRRVRGEADGDEHEHDLHFVVPEQEQETATSGGIRRSSGSGIIDNDVGWILPLMFLLVVRILGAFANIIHDCDEVFNYWEPLHYLLYNSGFQTWEYSAQFALRSYLYLLFHALFAAPASWLLGAEKRISVFYFMRLILGALSAISETILVVAVSRKYGKRLSWTTLVLLAFTTGCFAASTSFLPSTFSMYTLTLASATLLFDRPALAVAVAAFGVLVGWPFSFLCSVPLVIYSLTHGNFSRVFLSGAATTVIVMALSILTDYYFYGKWTSSVINLLTYNVLSGGGKSHLYGVEGPLFYFKNCFNNFNFAFLIALLFFPVMQLTKKRDSTPLMVVVSPVYIWLLFMSLQAHKEERFLYPIYPLICLAAAAVIERIPDLIRRLHIVEAGSVGFMGVKLFRPLFLGLILVLSHSRTTALLRGYSAPMTVYKTLAELKDVKNGSVLCVGNEWHRYPSSFFLPANISEVQWVDQGFRGLLPLPFNASLGGTASSPSYFNDMNKASNKQFLTDFGTCNVFVELDLEKASVSLASDSSTWETVVDLPFLDKQQSPALYRGFMIPGSWTNRNTFGRYRLLRRKLPVFQ